MMVHDQPAVDVEHHARDVLDAAAGLDDCFQDDGAGRIAVGLGRDDANRDAGVFYCAVLRDDRRGRRRDERPKESHVPETAGGSLERSDVGVRPGFDGASLWPGLEGMGSGLGWRAWALAPP